MLYYKIHIVYPNNEEEEIDQDFLTIKKAVEYAEHILGQVKYNAAFHSKSNAKSGDAIKVEPYCLIKEFSDKGVEVVFDSRNQ